MEAIDPTQVTVVSLLIAGITGLWAYFTKQEAAREKREKDEAKERETKLNERIMEKDKMILQIAQDSIKAHTEVKDTISNNTSAIKDLGSMTKLVLDELVRIKLLNGHKVN